MSRRKRKPDRNAWLVAWGLTLALHAWAILGFRHLPSLQPAPTAAHRPDPVQLVFEPPASKPSRTETPHFFSELPPDRADAAPVKPDFLSNVTSRARDLTPGGESALPKMNGAGDAPMVRLEPRGSPSSPAPPSPAPRPTEPAATSPAESAQPGGPQQQGQAGKGATASPAKPAEDRPRAPTDEAQPGSEGNSDTYQPEMDNPDGNVALTGDVSLNTIAWNYAPWLMRFKRQLIRRWIAPPAYYMGLMKEGGWAVIEVEISRSGEELRLDLLEAKGHPLLINAAKGAVSSMHPIDPLPADFPEPTLILRIRMVYPKILPR